jgi:hypothetical protein
MAVHYSCAPEDGCKKHPKHVELKTLQEKIILYIQLDLNKTCVTKMYGTTNIKNIKFIWRSQKC